MAKKRSTPARYVQPYRYPSPNIPLSAIRRFARQIAERFHPEKIILFGSYAYGQPHEESDVDLLVVMPTYDEIAQAIRIRRECERPFALDLIVKTPKRLERALKQENWFLREVVSKGKVLYEETNRAVGSQGRGGRTSRTRTRRSEASASRHRMLPLPAGRRKVLKALLQELSIRFPKTHDLEQLLDFLLPHDPTLRRLRRRVDALTSFAVEYRYPIVRAKTRQMRAALRTMERVRGELRARLGLPP
jgi:predicted nucleotidyltransferase